MKWVKHGLVLILILSSFKTSSMKVGVRDYKIKELVKTNVIANKTNVLNYLLTKVDSNRAKRMLAICLNETGLKSKYWKLNNLCCIRYGKRAISYTNYYGVYKTWTDCIDDLIEYENKYKSRSWYNRFNKELSVLIKQI